MSPGCGEGFAEVTEPLFAAAYGPELNQRFRDVVAAAHLSEKRQAVFEMYYRVVVGAFNDGDGPQVSENLCDPILVAVFLESNQGFLMERFSPVVHRDRFVRFPGGVQLGASDLTT